MGHLSTAELLEGWLPVRIFWRDARLWVDWCYMGDRRLTEPFFRESIGYAMFEPFNQAFRRETPIDTLRELREKSPGLEPAAFVHHASRCGSTLIPQMLTALGTHIAISEAPMFDMILRARHMAPGVQEDEQVEWLRGLVSALARPRNGETAFVVKLDAWNILALPLLQKAFPDTPWIYLYRDPLEIAVSHLRERGSFMIPGVLGPVQEMIPEATPLMRAEEFIARVLGKLFEAGRAGCVDRGGLPLHYNQLPQAVWTLLRERLRVGNDSRTLEVLQQAARRSAKNPQFEFEADSERKQREASPELRGLVDRWAAPAYHALERVRSGDQS
jgi:hypothetical protein